MGTAIADVNGTGFSFLSFAFAICESETAEAKGKRPRKNAQKAKANKGYAVVPRKADIITSASRSPSGILISPFATG